MTMNFLRELLLETMSDDDLERQFVAAAMQHGYGEAPPSFTFLANQMTTRFPEYTYEGKMYRIIAIPKAVIRQAASRSDVLTYIRANAVLHRVVSWSKTLKGVIRYHNLVAGKNENIAGERVFVLLEQTATGFDYRPWIQSYHQDRNNNVGMLYSSVQVFEVLAPLRQDARISLFFIRIGDSYVKFTPDNFGELKQNLDTSSLSDHVNPKAPKKKDLKYLSTNKKVSRVGIDFYDLPNT